MRISDWSSDVCSSDLAGSTQPIQQGPGAIPALVLERDRERAAPAESVLVEQFLLRTARLGHQTAIGHLGWMRGAVGAALGILLAGALTMLLTGGGGEAGGLPRSEGHTSELQALIRNSYAVFCVQ